MDSYEFLLLVYFLVGFLLRHIVQWLINDESKVASKIGHNQKSDRDIPRPPPAPPPPPPSKNRPVIDVRIVK
tara:strand:- start:1420 stop:1635 length:216 start_codon:yes stop_codon:yes gene_type:complete